MLIKSSSIEDFENIIIYRYIKNEDKYIPLTWSKTKENIKMKDLEKVIIKKYEKEKLKNLRKKRLFNNSQIEKIKELREKGLSYREIAKEMNCSEGTIRNYLKKSTQTP